MLVHRRALNEWMEEKGASEEQEEEEERSKRRNGETKGKDMELWYGTKLGCRYFFVWKFRIEEIQFRYSILLLS